MYAANLKLSSIVSTSILITSLLVFSSSAVAQSAGVSCGFPSGADDHGTDFGLDSEWPRMERRFAEQIDNFVKAGYPTASILTHAVANGLTIDKALYMMTRADNERAEEFFKTAVSLQGSLPGWSCSASNTNSGDSYSDYYELDDLGRNRSVSEVAERYFDQKAVMEPFPDWFNGESHMNASIDELIGLADDDFWYRKNSNNTVVNNGVKRPVLISLYAETEEVVLDIARSELESLKARGQGDVPVVFYYNKTYQAPVGRFDETPKLDDIMDVFSSRGEQLTPVPLLNTGDFHLPVSGDEFEDLFNIPDADDISPERLNVLKADLQRDGFSKKPVVLTMYSEQDSSWIDDPERVRAALELGLDDIPVAVLYHKLDRMTCGAVPNCVRRMCSAISCAGGFADSCTLACSFRVIQPDNQMARLVEFRPRLRYGQKSNPSKS